MPGKLALEGISLDLAIESFLFLVLLLENYKKKELRMPHMLHIFNVFREHDGKENCAQVLKEELHRMLGIEYVNDEHDCNVVSMNSLNIHDANCRCQNRRISGRGSRTVRLGGW